MKDASTEKKRTVGVKKKKGNRRREGPKGNLGQGDERPLNYAEGLNPRGKVRKTKWGQNHGRFTG